MSNIQKIAKDSAGAMDEQKARAIASELEKFLLLHGIYYKETKEHLPGLKFIRYEVSLKVG